MASRLYPGFGSGRGTYEETLKVVSVGSVGRSDLEAGDKVLLPASAFKEISRLKLAMPLLFQVFNDKLKPTVPARPGGAAQPPPPPEQCCGVLEFSAPEGQALVPSWMLRNLRLRDGGTARFTTVRGVPPGSFVRFRPYSAAFVELAAAVGPRDLLEAALRNYSALTTGQRLVIDVADTQYPLDVVEVRPGGKVCLFGNLDLEVEFAPVGDATALARGGAEAGSSGSAAAVAGAGVGRVASGAASGGAASSAKRAPTAVPGRPGTAGSAAAAPAAAPRPTVALTPPRTHAPPPGSSSSSSSLPAGSALSAARSPSRQAAAAIAGGGLDSRRPGGREAGVGRPPAALPLAAAAAMSVATGPASPQISFPGTGPTGSAGMSFPGLHSFAGAGGSDAVGGYTLGSFASASSTLVPADTAAAPPQDPAELAAARAAARRKAAAAALQRMQAAAAEAPAGPQEPPSPAAAVVPPAEHPSPMRATVQKGWLSDARKAAARHGGAAPTGGDAGESKGGDEPPAAAAGQWGGKEADCEGGAGPSRSPAPARRTVAAAAGASDGKEGDAPARRPQLRSPTLPSPHAATPAGAASPMAPRPSSATAAADTSVVGGTAISAASRACPTCGSAVPAHNFDMHTARCRRNADYHSAAPCAVCGAALTQKAAAAHVHCPACRSLVEEPSAEDVAGAAGDARAAAAAALARHSSSACPHRTVPCHVCALPLPVGALAAHVASKHAPPAPAAAAFAAPTTSATPAVPAGTTPCAYCRVPLKAAALAAHEGVCGARTSACETCGRLVVLAQRGEHETSGACVAALAAAAARKAVSEAKQSDDASSSGGVGLGALTQMADRHGREGAAGRAVAAGPASSAVNAARTSAMLAAALDLPAGAAAAPALSSRGLSARSAAASKPSSRSGSRPPSSGGGSGGAVATPKAVAPRAAPAGAGASDSGGISRRTAGGFPCPHCNAMTPDYEALQMHVFTACPSADGGVGSRTVAAPAMQPSVGAKPTARGVASSAVLGSSRAGGSSAGPSALPGAAASRTASGSGTVVSARGGTGTSASAQGVLPVGSRPSFGGAASRR